MATFVDSSALYALIDRDDRYHDRARRAWEEARDREEQLVTHNYVLLETSSLLQRRIGTDAVRVLHDEVVPALTIRWFGPEDHDDAVRAVAASRRGEVSLVDQVSFLVMRREGIASALAFDEHFGDEGFTLVG